MAVLTRTGLILESPTPEIKKELTVRPLVNNEYGFPPPPFKVYRTAKSGICVPRFYGTDVPTQDKRPAPTKTRIKFTGKLRDATHQNEAHAAAIRAGHGVLSLPCGYGNTTVTLAIACTLGLRTIHSDHQ